MKANDPRPLPTDAELKAIWDAQQEQAQWKRELREALQKGDMTLANELARKLAGLPPEKDKSQ
jgi:phage shock protein A